jgi:hypothetical protein
MSTIEVIPVIELPTRKWDEAGPTPMHPLSKHLSEWESYWDKLQKVSGYNRAYKRITPGICLYRLDQFTNIDDISLIVQRHLHPANDLEEVRIQDSTPLFGGYILNIENDLKLYPQCCCDLGDFMTWNSILRPGFNKAYLFKLSGGHPSPIVTKKGLQVLFTCQDDDDDSFNPKTDENIIIHIDQLREALKQTSKELFSFASFIDTLSETYQVTKLSDYLIAME